MTQMTDHEGAQRGGMRPVSHGKKKTPSPCRLTQREAFEDWQALQERWKRHNQSMITKLLTIAYDASARA